MERQESSRKLQPAALGAAFAAALASSLCCVVPFVLVSIGITGPWLARLRVFDPLRIPFELASVVALAAAWLVHVRGVRSCSTAGCALPLRLRRTRIGLALASVLIVALVAAPYVIARIEGV